MILTPTTTIQAQSAQSKWDPDRQQADCSVGGAEAAGARGTPASCCKPRHLRRDHRPGAEHIQRQRHGEVDTFQMICCAQRDLVHVGELARLTPASRRRQEMTTSSDSQAGFRVAKRQMASLSVTLNTLVKASLIVDIGWQCQASPSVDTVMRASRWNSSGTM